jgi:hypothetical protein
MQSINTSSGYDEERAELDRVLSSSQFKRAPSISRILQYLCEKHFRGEASTLKEYTIAVEALGKSPDFDPQTDAVVRVTFHTLRKRLKDYYEGHGLANPIRIILPQGQYLPLFSSAVDLSGPANSSVAKNHFPPDKEAPLQSATTTPLQPLHVAILKNRFVIGLICGIFGMAVGIWTALAVNHRSRYSVREMTGWPAMIGPAVRIAPQMSEPSLADHLDRAIRIRAGSDIDYLDTAGFRWLADRFFSGGAPFHRKTPVIARSSDPEIYSFGRTGTFEYAIPVKPGQYEIHLLFAETDPEFVDNERDVSYTIGSGPQHTLDVVSDAGNTSTATMKIYAGQRPGRDGKVHIAFQCPQCFVNAIEIIPNPKGRPDPIRISASRSTFVDPEGRHWLPERFELGGHSAGHVFSRGQTDSLLLRRERYGRFDYLIPVAEGFEYRVSLHMAERFWGTGNSGEGGIGSRIFDVQCNGTTLLSKFDILKTQGNADWVSMTFEHLKPDETGKLDIQFVPRVNFALVNAIEVSAE